MKCDSQTAAAVTKCNERKPLGDIFQYNLVSFIRHLARQNDEGWKLIDSDLISLKLAKTLQCENSMQALSILQSTVLTSVGAYQIIIFTALLSGKKILYSFLKSCEWKY